MAHLAQSRESGTSASATSVGGYPIASGNTSHSTALSLMVGSHESRRKRGILEAIARRLRAFYQFMQDDSLKGTHELFDRAVHQK